MFKKLFGRKEAPTNAGKPASSGKGKDVRWVKKFVLELSNMEGSPSYTLSHQLTVGSEVGNIVIADPSVSPRHCTFILQEEVVSVLDHGSVQGTFVNGQKIPPGRYIILEETDTVLVGELEVKIHVKTQSVEEGIPEDELDEPDNTSAEEPEEEVEANEEEEAEEQEEDIEVDDEEEAPKKPKTSFFQKFFKPKKAAAPKPVAKKTDGKKKGNLSFSGHSSYATNSLVRVFAVLGDVFIAYILYIIFSPFDEFRAFVNDSPALLGELLGIEWSGLWAILNEEYAFVGEMLKDLYTFVSKTFQIGPFFLLFIMVRLISTLLLGVSISELMLGVRSHGNAIWKRIGGVLRVVLGIFTGPFLIFDVPAVVSRRTFKEFMTFTHTYLSSKFIAILGTILYLPLLVVLALLSPLLQGLELPEPIAINAKVDQRVKVVQTGEAVEVVKIKDHSSFLHVDLTYEPDNVSLIPFFKFSGQKKKLNLKPGLAIYQKDLQRVVQLEVFKTFDFQELLAIGMKNNFFLYEKFPEIYKYVYSSDAANPAFRKKINERGNRKFADEVLSFTRLSFELSADNAIEYMEMYTPFLKGLMDYRSSFLALLEYKEFDQIDFFKLGNASFLRISYLRQKPFDLIIPLIPGEGKIFKIEFDKKENLGALSSKFYKFSLNGANWFPEESNVEGETLTPLQVLDFVSKLNLKGDKINSDRAQALYGYYFEKSSEILKREDPVEMEIWKKSVDSIFTIMEKMKDSVPKAPEIAAVPEAVPEATPESSADTQGEAPAAPVAVTPETPATEATSVEPAPVEPAPVEEDPRMKLYQNFQDLKDAVDNKNKEFFGIQESVNL